MSNRAINEAAAFHPVTGLETVPVLQVAGAYVSVYVDGAGALCVSVDLDDCTLPDPVPMRVSVQGETVWEA